MTEPAPHRRAAQRICAIVVGAASGTGEQFAHALAAHGAALLLVDRDEFALARIRHDLDAEALHCDVLDEQCVSAMFDVAERFFPHVDLLINAAGAGYIRTLGVMRASREFARRPRFAKSVVVNIAAGRDGRPDPFEYAGSHVAFHRLTRGLAQAIETAELKVMTLERIDTPEAVADLTGQLVRQLSSNAAETDQNLDLDKPQLNS